VINDKVEEHLVKEKEAEDAAREAAEMEADAGEG